MRFSVTVTETIAVTKLYKIEAATIEEAREKASIGDTESETELRTEGVLDRTVEHVEESTSADAS